MCGLRGTESEKTSDLPEPGATARSESCFVALNLSVALKIPLLFATTYATVRRGLAVAKLDRDALLVARRVQAPDAHRRAVQVRDERELEGRQHRLGPRARERRRMEVQAALVRAAARLILEVDHVTSETPERQTW